MADDRTFKSERDLTDKYLPSPTLSELNAKLMHRDDWELLKSCPACNEPSIRPFASIRHISYDRCDGCGFVFANPAPPAAVVSNFYNSDFYNNYRTLEETTIGDNPYFSMSAYTDPVRLAGWLKCDKSASILDFGCGPGSFVALLRDKFCFENVEGLELNKKSAGIALRHYALKLALDVNDLMHQQYDVIILFEVIEHITKPDEVLSLCSRLLRPGGLLFITTPSVRSIPARYFPSHCVHYTGPSHVSLFTETALTRLLARFCIHIERLEIDRNRSIFGNFVAKPVYNLDFASPRSRVDVNDALFSPNHFGRLLGLKPSRSMGPIFNGLRRLDRLMGHAFMKVSGHFFSDHLYVLAKKHS
jgi:2-polyprenyl-3-methyl-5-hydroxy-6-metoxy-1,4-benzoquinol methylase